MGTKQSRQCPVYNAGKYNIEVEIKGTKTITKTASSLIVVGKVNFKRKETTYEPNSNKISPGEIHIFNLTKDQKGGSITVTNEKNGNQIYLQHKKGQGIIYTANNTLVYSKKLDFENETQEKDATIEEKTGIDHQDMYENKANQLVKFKENIIKIDKEFKKKSSEILSAWERKMEAANLEKADKLQKMIDERTQQKKKCREMFEISSDEDEHEPQDLRSSRKYIKESMGGNHKEKRKKDEIKKDMHKLVGNLLGIENSD